MQLATFFNATVKMCDFKNCNFAEAVLQFATFRETDLSDSTFAEADIFETAFVSCPVFGTDFTEAKNLNNAVFGTLIGAKVPDWYCNISPR